MVQDDRTVWFKMISTSVLSAGGKASAVVAVVAIFLTFETTQRVGDERLNFQLDITCSDFRRTCRGIECDNECIGRPVPTIFFESYAFRSQRFVG